MPASWPRLAARISSLGANQSPAIHCSNDSRASRRSSLNGTSDSGAIIPAADSGSFSRCVPQNGHFSVTTLSSSSTVAPQPVQRTCDECPATVLPPPDSSLARYSSKSRSTTSADPSASSAMTVACPQYGHFSERDSGSNSILAPHFSQGNSFPLGGVLGSCW